MIIKDYSKEKTWLKTYGGSEEKLSIKLEDGIYMVKAPTKAPDEKRSITGTYYNNVLSEYIGSHIFGLSGIPTQETKLGYYNDKLVVLCKDFVKKNEYLQEFFTYKNGFISESSSGKLPELSEIFTTINENAAIPESIKAEAIERFWDMFVIDALIGNPDRHNGNWGFIYNDMSNTVKLAPVYDCGASLFARMDDEKKIGILNNRPELDMRIYNRPLSAITINRKKINYNDFFIHSENRGFKNALKRIVPRIDMDAIFSMISEIPVLNAVNNEFYKTILEERFEKVINKAYKKLIKSSENKKDNQLSRIFGCNISFGPKSEINTSEKKQFSQNNRGITGALQEDEPEM